MFDPNTFGTQQQKTDAPVYFKNPGTEGFFEPSKFGSQAPKNGIPSQNTGDFGTGFTPTKQFTGEESLPEAVVKTVQNAPKSAFEFGKNLFTAVTQPVETFKALRDITAGGLQTLGESVGRNIRTRKDTEETDIDTREEQTFDTAMSFFEERYGGADKFKETVVEDPVGVLADLAGVLSGVGAGVRVAGTASKVGSVARAGTAISRAGQIIEPTSIVARVARGLSEPARVTKSVSGNVSRAIIPSTEQLIAQSLELTPGDLRKIQNKTGQQVADFVITRIEKTADVTPEDIVIRLEDVVQNTRNEVRTLISNVPAEYAPTQVPRVQQALTELQNLYDGKIGLETVNTEIKSLLNNESYSLNDIQRVKELIDDADIIFRQSGEVKAGVSSRGLANVRKEIKEFIEEQVQQNIGSEEANIIRSLNNEVQTAKEIALAVESRATRGVTRAPLSLSDFIVGGSALGVGADPFTVVGIVLARRALQSPAFRISLAKSLNKLGNNQITEIIGQIKSNSVTRRTQELLREAIENAGATSGFTSPVIENIREISDLEQLEETK